MRTHPSDDPSPPVAGAERDPVALLARQPAHLAIGEALGRARKEVTACIPVRATRALSRSLTSAPPHPGPRVQGRRREMAIQIPVMALGIGLFFAAVVIGFLGPMPGLSAREAADMRRIGLVITYALGSLVLLLALVPTQRRVVRVGMVIYACFMVYTVWAYVAIIVVPRAHELVDTAGVCGADGRSTPACTIILIQLAQGTVLALIHACAIVLVLGAQRSARMPARAKLDLVWRVYAVTHVAMGAVALFEDIQNALGARPGRAPPFTYSVVLLLAGVVAATGRLREAVQSWLASRSERVSSAILISVLLNGRSMEEAFFEAQESFRSVSADKVDADGLASRLSEEECFRQSDPAALGSVDAFVCHSHHDSAEEKEEQLRLWAEEFRLAHGRVPRLWLDQYCLDNSSPDSSLACLPVYLAACDRVLVLHGPTVQQRLCAHARARAMFPMLRCCGSACLPPLMADACAPLTLARPAALSATAWCARLAPGVRATVMVCSWCVVELFIHLTIGRDRARMMNVLRLPSLTDTSPELSIEHFDARQAQCNYSEDRQLLLTVLEAYPGGIPAFNAAVSLILAEPLTCSQPTSPAPLPPRSHQLDALMVERHQMESELRRSRRGDGPLQFMQQPRRCGPAC